MAQPFLVVTDIVKRFDDVCAVDRVSLTINRGEIFAILGSSGCGKTTLLRMLAGFDEPSSGTMELGGISIAELPPYKRPINMMFQSYALFPHLTVWDNIAFGLRRDGLPKDEISDTVGAMLALTQLGAYAKRKPASLSGGQQQRVALARSLAKRPQLLLLDEPLGALDKKLREQTQFELANIIEKVGVTCVMVTHDQDEAMVMADRIAVMNEGRVIQVGTPHQLYEAPNCRFVAEFIGDINIFEGKVTEKGLSTPIGTLGMPVANVAVGSHVAVAVRPEKLAVAVNFPPPEEEAANVFRGVVKEIAYLGTHHTYVIAPTEGKRIKVTMVNASRANRTITWEDEVFFWWDTVDSVLLRQ